MVALAVAMGLGRFAFTPTLPVMLNEGKLDLTSGGWLASLNYLGYFFGALSCAAIRIRAPTMVRASLLATGMLLLGMGWLDGFVGWGILRTAAGVVSAWALVFASGWGSRRLAQTHSPALGGVIFTGPGIGIAVTGLLGGAIGRWGSDAAWLAFGLVALAASAAIWRIFDDGEANARADGEPDAEAIGEALDGVIAPAAAAAADSGARLIRSPGSAPNVAGRRHDARWLVGLYGLAGFGYIITATFLPVIAREAMPASGLADLFWPLIGLAIIPGALIAARAPIEWDNRLLMAAGYAMQMLGVLLSVTWPTPWGFGLGSLLLGLPFTAITMFAVREARRLRGDDAPVLIGFATASYGIGQIVGPLFAAPLAHDSGSFAIPLLVAACALGLGSALFIAVWWQARRHDDDRCRVPDSGGAH